ncbi:MAG: hypothetical protein COZ46_06960 [Verrucomicrobia bacterium CG_4_10_14_3_um_filter_43_23]|nr:MAG: hypothetical protein AUJ82_05015 [Verrucomicrobia bacterium CG1_02_43_26]PIP59828.1 MAG: hypothetical protein COX01_01565 [Verrucomicrobia bacterium CG22_combo_CG10-13_8_21_14_all_43_17]PIX57840.1 MAG: hypothetical protein COZ46_06960 [Verrucomicrobia bacterium CG_4_10_14_3_um_filter_43_23]PIY63045.1 MAG: hypothetical protein COY94_00505 [Verrucomicrobia bacterium CG_4_10_14_0_8_um_filter_43_34]PJA43707.1 MAG: hypothetical protein CO175_06660 [Verrucomicrobia bacterium CG_4_9_14_3_um_fi
MATTKPRLNITLEKEVEKELSLLAKRRSQSVSSLAKELIMESLERREDFWLSRVAKERSATSKKRLSHKDVWGE